MLTWFSSLFYPPQPTVYKTLFKVMCDAHVRDAMIIATQKNQIQELEARIASATALISRTRASV